MDSKFIDLPSTVNNLTKILKDLNVYKDECNSQLSECDKTIVDLQHCLEFERLDAIQLTQIVVRLRDTLIKRRYLKEELAYVYAISSADSNIKLTITRLNQIRDAYCKQVKEERSKLYSPRVDRSLFSPEKILDQDKIKYDSNSSNGNKKYLTYTDSKGKKHKIYNNKYSSLDLKLKQISAELNN